MSRARLCSVLLVEPVELKAQNRDTKWPDVLSPIDTAQVLVEGLSVVFDQDPGSTTVRWNLLHAIEKNIPVGKVEKVVLANHHLVTIRSRHNLVPNV